jgi:hypothetical protein
LYLRVRMIATRTCGQYALIRVDRTRAELESLFVLCSAAGSFAANCRVRFQR